MTLGLDRFLALGKRNRAPLVVASFIVIGAVSGALMAIGSDLPQVEELEELKPNIVTQVFAADGSILGEFAIEKRIIISYEDIPDVLRNAIIATEDEDFFNHIGINLWRIPGAVWANFQSGRKGQGFSTLTMQLSRLLFLSPQKTYERKLREILLALEIERRFTKKEIFTLYCNLVNFGHGNYGVEAASLFYFGKPAKSLNLEEAALIAGIPQSPSRLSPLDHPEAATRRRNHALDRMAAENYITAMQAKTAQYQPLGVTARRSPPSIAPYFLEEVRKTLERDYGFSGIYRDGLKVYTTLDPRLQIAANRAVRDGILRNDRAARGFKPGHESALKEGVVPSGFSLPDWRQPFEIGDVVRGVVRSVGRDLATLQVGDTEGRLPVQAIAWTGKSRMADVVKVGDIVPVRIVAFEGAGRRIAEVAFEQEPDAESALLAMDTRSGAVKAMIGGFDFERSRFNRAVQAHRQTGSIFKAIVYSAAVESLGWGPDTLILDAPISFTSAGSPTWSPRNYDLKFEGTITVRHAIEESRNVPAIKTLQAIGVEKGIEYARKFGLKDDLPPYLPIAIGAGEATLAEMVAAFGTIANEGLRMTPILVTRITDNEGNVLEENLPEAYDAIRPETAATMANILRGVVERGTAVRAKSLNRPALCGKTGTTDDWSDTWFVGFERALVAGVWSGFDDKRKSLGRGRDGARTSLPIFMDFWKEAIKELPADPAFPPPLPAALSETVAPPMLP